MAGNNSGTGENGSPLDTNTPPLTLHGIHNLSIYDFYQMTIMDWDKVFKGHFNQLRYNSWNGLNIVRLTLCIWILASHLALIVFILCKSALRHQPKNILIINVSLANVLVGVFLIPAKLHFIISPDIPDCELSIAWTLMNDYFQVCLSLLTVLGLVVERLVYVYTEHRRVTLNRLATWLNCLLYFILPWVVTTLLVVPIFYEALVEQVPKRECAFRVRDNYFLILQVLSFVPAGLAVFVTAPLAGLLDCLRSKTCIYSPSTPRGESLVIASVTSFLAVFGEAPYFVVRILLMCLECNNPYCMRFNTGITIGMWFRIAKASVLPFLWLAYSDIRYAMLCGWDYKKVKDEGIEEADDSESVNTRL